MVHPCSLKILEHPPTILRQEDCAWLIRGLDTCMAPFPQAAKLSSHNVSCIAAVFFLSGDLALSAALARPEAGGSAWKLWEGLHGAHTIPSPDCK